VTIATPKARPLALPSVLVCCLLSTACVPEVSRKVELSATQAALQAQMAETARLEREAMEAEAATRLPEENPHEPESDTELPAQIAVDDPAGMVDEAGEQEAAAAPAAGEVAITEEEIAEVPEEPYAPEPEEETAAPPEEAVASETAVAVLDAAADEQPTGDPWADYRRSLVGTSAPGSTDTLLITASLDRIARAIEQQNMLEVMEARLQDKQRSIDELRAMLLPGGTLPEGDDAATTAANSRLEQQLQALMGNQRALAASVQAMQDDKEVADAQAADDAAARQAADEAAAKKAAQDERDAQEQARWDSLMQRLEAIESAPQSAEPVAMPEAGSDAPITVDDPRVADLQARLESLEQAQTERGQALDQEADDQTSRHRQEREEAASAMEARYAALADMQEKAIKELEKERREQRRWWQFWRQKQAEDATAAGSEPAPSIDIDAETARIKEENQQQWDELLARQEAERAELEQQRAAAAEQRAALEAQVAELSQRLEAAESAGSQVDPAELERLNAIAASVEDLNARTEALNARASDLEAQSVAKQQRIRERLQPIIDAGLKVTIADDRARIHLPGDVLFSSGSSTLGATGKSTVDSIASVLNSARGLKLQVEGHTDNVPISGGARTNWDLGFARARAVLDRLIADGIPAESVSAASYGDTRPIASNDTADGRALNRRIELVVLLAD